MAKARHVPLSFVMVVAALVALFIFFGAWAVSVDAANHERQLSFPVGNSGAGFGVNPVPSQTGDATTSSETADGSSFADTWWGQTLLFTCPLH